MKTSTLLQQRRLLAVTFILFMTGAGCKPKTNETGYQAQLSADRVENNRLAGVLFSSNRDSIMNCADVDYKANKYYIFRTCVPFEGKFEDYLVSYTKEKYGMTLVNCDCKSYAGAYYYNTEMAECFAKANVKPFSLIYLEAKSTYNEELLKLP